MNIEKMNPIEFEEYMLGDDLNNITPCVDTLCNCRSDELHTGCLQYKAKRFITGSPKKCMSRIEHFCSRFKMNKKEQG